MPTTATVNLFYDSLGRVVEDSQTYDGNTRDVTNSAFTSYPATEVTYPNDRQVTTSHDVLYRKALVEETSGGADIAAWNYLGPARVAELTLGNGLICSFLNNDRTRSAIQPDQTTPGWGDQSSDRLGYDGAGRLVTKRWLAGGIDGGTGAYDDPTAVMGQTTAYDRASNKLYERALHAESRSTLYEPINTAGEAVGGYDSINRLRQYQRGILSEGRAGGDPAPAGGSVKDPITLPNTNESAGYVLDGLGNWRRFVTDPVGGNPGTQVRQHNNLNEITRTDDGDGPVLFSYDGVPGASNGNLANDGVRSYEWDALNRLKRVYKDPNGTPAIIGDYAYDALGRRIRKIVTNGGLSGIIPNGTTDFVYNTRWQCLEERDGSDDPFKQYVWGLYIDELIQLTTFTTINGNAAGTYYPLQDTLYRTLALTDGSGDLVETYDYDPYGNTLIFTAAGTGSDWWADDATRGDYPVCEQLFTGQRYDAEKETYQYRRREYNYTTGRFSSRDFTSDKRYLSEELAKVNLASDMKVADDGSTVSVYYLQILAPYWYVEGRPTWGLDPTGQDIYLMQGNDSGGAINDMLHQQIEVDLWDEHGIRTGRAYYSFGLDKKKGCGVVYEAHAVSGAEIKMQKYTTIEEDRAFLLKMQSLNQRTGTYALILPSGQNCRDWSQEQFNDAPGKPGLVRRIPPNREPPPPPVIVDTTARVKTVPATREMRKALNALNTRRRIRAAAGGAMLIYNSYR